MHISDIDPEFPLKRKDYMWEKLKKNKFLSFQSTHKSKDGTTFPVQVISRYLKFKSQEYEFAFVIDISTLKEKENELIYNMNHDNLT